MGRLEGRVAIVTGAARGIGAAIAARFVSEGAHVLLADVADDAGRALADRLGERALYQHADVTREADWTAVVAEAKSLGGHVDVLVNNAGVMRANRIEDIPLEEYMQVVAVNQVGPFLGMRACIPAMREVGRGSIITLSSAMGMSGRAGVGAYTSTKFAVRGLSKTLALELAPAGIRSNTIHPGGIDTEMTVPGDAVDPKFLASIPMGRLAEPSEVADLALFLASDESSYCSGHEFVIDGAMLAGPWP